MERFNGTVAAGTQSADIASLPNVKISVLTDQPVQLLVQQKADPGKWSMFARLDATNDARVVECPGDVIRVRALDSAAKVSITDSAGVAGNPTGSVVSTQGFPYVSITSITRPANVTAYAAGDVLGAADARLSLLNVGPAGGGVILTGASLRISATAVPSGMSTFRLYLFSAQPTPIADNAALGTYLADNATLFRGYVDLSNPLAAGGLLYTQSDGINKQLELAPSQTQVWGVLLTNGAFTPAANSEIYTLKLYTLSV